MSSLDANDPFSRIWRAFDAGEILTACAWCGRVCIDGDWLGLPRAALAAIDERHAFSHSICERCVAGSAMQPIVHG